MYKRQGLRWDVNAALAEGSRVSNIEVRDNASGNWLPLDPDRTYKLFVLSFNANGGDGYKTLAKVPAARRQDIGVLDADVLQAYIDRPVSYTHLDVYKRQGRRRPGPASRGPRAGTPGAVAPGSGGRGSGADPFLILQDGYRCV